MENLTKIMEGVGIKADPATLAFVLGYQAGLKESKGEKCCRDMNPYDRAFHQTMCPKGRLKFWGEQAKNIDWDRFPKNILDETNPPFYRWFKDGMMNICYNCVDRHLEKNGDKRALVYDSTICNYIKEYTFNELHDNVSRLGGVLRNKFNIGKGDRVIIYMPMIPEAIFAMLACARIGAIHSVVFGGFSAKELGSRITDAKPKLIISASCGIEPHKTLDYKKIVDEARKIANNPSLPALIK